jgi:hypothetical protein
MPMITIRSRADALLLLVSNVNHSSSGRLLSLAIARTESALRGSYAGVWRSDDAGRHWHQLIGP